jgi:ubiquinone biosynthesis protein UbiJ
LNPSGNEWNGLREKLAWLSKSWSYGTKEDDNETLAEMINEGFKTTATKEDIKDVREDIATVNGQLDRIEHLLIEEQRRTIENLEKRMKKLEDALAI